VSLRKLNQYKYKKASNPPIKYVPSGSNNEDAVWIEPTLVATVEYMPNDRASFLIATTFATNSFAISADEHEQVNIYEDQIYMDSE
jgi:hypothetical protein